MAASDKELTKFSNLSDKETVRKEWVRIKTELIDVVHKHLSTQDNLIDYFLKDPCPTNGVLRSSKPKESISYTVGQKDQEFDCEVVDMEDESPPGRLPQPPAAWQDRRAWCSVPGPEVNKKTVTFPESPPDTPLKLTTHRNTVDISAEEMMADARRLSVATGISGVSALHEVQSFHSQPPGVRELAKMDLYLSKLEKWLETWQKSTHEPHRRNRLAQFESGSIFNFIGPCVILLDAGYTAWSSNRSARDPGIAPTTAMKVVEVLFTVFYIFELSVRLTVHRCYFFYNANWTWNWFDLVLVIQSCVDVFITYVIKNDGGSLTFLRLLRLMKIGKILRVFRAIRFLRDLRAMIIAIINCLSALFWAFITLALILYVFALILLQSITAYREDHASSLDHVYLARIVQYLGSLERTALTLYMCTTSGVNWYDIYNMFEDVGPFEAASFIFFIGFYGFAVVTILSGIFIEKALAAAQPDRESMALEQRRLDESDTLQLKTLLRTIDCDNNGRLTYDEFTMALEDLHVQAYLRSLGLAVNDAAMFFNLLVQQSGSNELQIEDIAQRMCRMKGAATAMDLQSLMFETSIIRKLVIELADSVHETIPAKGSKHLQRSAHLRKQLGRLWSYDNPDTVGPLGDQNRPLSPDPVSSIRDDEESV